MLYQLSYLGVSEQSFYADSRECQKKYAPRFTVYAAREKKKRDACPSPLTDKRRAVPLRGYLPTQTPMRGDNRSKRRRRSAKFRKQKIEPRLWSSHSPTNLLRVTTRCHIQTTTTTGQICGRGYRPVPFIAYEVSCRVRTERCPFCA